MRSLLKQPEIRMYFYVSQNPPTASSKLGVVWHMLILKPSQQVREQLPLVKWLPQNVTYIIGSQMLLSEEF